MPLTDTAIRNAKPSDKVRTLSDAHGLQMRILPSGGKSWRYSYRHDSKQKSVVLGKYPEMSLSEARAARDVCRKQLSQGLDPVGERDKTEREAELAKGATFQAVADEFTAKMAREGKAEITLSKRRWLMDMACAEFGNRPIAEIRPADVLALLRKIEARGMHETAKRMRSACGSVFRYAIATDRRSDDPTVALKGAITLPTVTNMAAITDPVRLGALLLAMDSYKGTSDARSAMKLLALTAVRPSELRLSRWSEFNLEEATWDIPATRAKMRRPHRVPLAIATLDILRDMWVSRSRQRLDDYLFPGLSADRPMSENTVNKALKSMGFPDQVGHGFRATFSSLSHESGLWAPDVIELALGHAIGGIRGVYARHAAWDERKKLAEWWAGELLRMKLLASGMVQ